MWRRKEQTRRKEPCEPLEHGGRGAGNVVLPCSSPPYFFQNRVAPFSYLIKEALSLTSSYPSLTTSWTSMFSFLSLPLSGQWSCSRMKEIIHTNSVPIPSAKGSTNSHCPSSIQSLVGDHRSSRQRSSRNNMQSSLFCR